MGSVALEGEAKGSLRVTTRPESGSCPVDRALHRRLGAPTVRHQTPRRVQVFAGFPDFSRDRTLGKSVWNPERVKHELHPIHERHAGADPHSVTLD
jgi:hypothetical protein